MMTKSEIVDLIARDEQLSALLARTKKEFGSSGRKDPGHDVEHSFRVALWTIRIGRSGGDSFRVEAAIAAALLHDLVNPPKNSVDRARASELSASKARTILPEFGFHASEISDICDAIRTHSFSRGEEPKSPLGRALQDADRLEALGAIGLFRTLATGVIMGAELVCEEDPWARNRPLDDKKYSIDHFFAKLLKLPTTMKTKEGKAEALRRAKYLEEFLAQLGTELGVPYER